MNHGKPGPKPLFPGQQTVRPTISLPRNYAEFFAAIGGGNVSAGVRRAAELALEAMPDETREKLPVLAEVAPAS